MPFKNGEMAVQELSSSSTRIAMPKIWQSRARSNSFSANLTAMNDGGPVTLVYGFLFCWFGALVTASSLAEMASMAPTSSGQYHWVAMLAPKGQAKFLSWVTGWMAMIG
ncbi:unnamed protein product [Penicillium crustosum]